MRRKSHNNRGEYGDIEGRNTAYLINRQAGITCYCQDVYWAAPSGPFSSACIHPTLGIVDILGLSSTSADQIPGSLVVTHMSLDGGTNCFLVRMGSVWTLGSAFDRGYATGLRPPRPQAHGPQLRLRTPSTRPVCGGRRAHELRAGYRILLGSTSSPPRPEGRSCCP